MCYIFVSRVGIETGQPKKMVLIASFFEQYFFSTAVDSLAELEGANVNPVLGPELVNTGPCFAIDIK